MTYPDLRAFLSSVSWGLALVGLLVIWAGLALALVSASWRYLVTGNV